MQDVPFHNDKATTRKSLSRASEGFVITLNDIIFQVQDFNHAAVGQDSVCLLQKQEF